MYKLEKKLLPEFPRTMHLPLEANASSDDLVATVEQMDDFLSGYIVVEEKLDGSNSGITIIDGEPVIRNRTHILNKAYDKDTPAKKQFKPIWSWFYQNRKKFEKLEKLVGFIPSVYGEWLVATHTLSYDELPDLWIPYDIYDSNTGQFMSPFETHAYLEEAGFIPAPLLARGELPVEQLLMLRDGPRIFSSSGFREGIYLRSATARYKMVAPWFKSDDEWAKKPMVQNKLIRL